MMSCQPMSTDAPPQKAWELVHAHANAVAKLLGNTEVRGGDGKPVIIRPLGRAPAEPIIKYLVTEGFTRNAYEAFARYVIFDHREEAVMEKYVKDIGNCQSIIAELWYTRVVFVGESWTNLSYVMMYPRVGGRYD